MSLLYKNDNTHIIIFGNRYKNKALLTIKNDSDIISFHTTIFKENANIFFFDEDYETIDTILGEVCVKENALFNCTRDNQREIITDLMKRNFATIDEFVNKLHLLDEFIIEIIFDNFNIDYYLMIYYKNNIFVEHKMDNVDKLYERCKKDSIKIDNNIDYDVEFNEEIKPY